MRLTPAQRRDIRRWTAANARARRAYEEQPASGRYLHDGTCPMPYCDKPVHGDGLCARHEQIAKRDRGEVGAA